MRREVLVSAASADESLATSVLAEGLTGRLAQRGSEPIGVIDVRRPQQHYTRMAGWLGQRLPLLNQLLSRYHDGGEHGTGAGDFVYRSTPSFPPDMPTAFTPVNAYSPAVSIARPISVLSIAVAGNDRSSPADTVFSATTVTGSSAAPPEAAPSAVARQAGLTPLPGSQLGKVGIADFAPAAITSHDYHFGQPEEPGLRFARGAINRASTPAPSRLRHYATYGPNDDHGPITRTAATVSTRPLPERLAQRGSEPLGVIDAHQPQQHYTRAAGWFGQRLPLLNQLLTRYHDGEEQRTGVGNFVYRAAPSFPPETPDIFAMGNSFSPTAGAAWPIPIQSATAAGNNRLSPAAAVLSAAAVSGSSAAPPQLAPSTVARRADLRPSPGSHLGRVGIAHHISAVIATAAGTESPGATTATAAQFTDLTPLAVERGESSATPAVTLRVRRQAPPLADAVSAPPGEPLTETTADGHTSPAAGLLNRSAAPSPLPASEAMENRLVASGVRPAATLPLATRVQAPLPIQPRSMARQPAGDGVARVFRDRAIAASPLPGDNLLPAAAPSPTRSPVRGAAPAGDRPIAGAGRLPELQPTTVGPEPVIARKAIGAVSSASGAMVDATPTAGAFDPTRAGLPDSMPFARRTSALQLSESITGTADKPALPVISEKPVATAADPVPGLVWRKSITAPPTSGAGNSGTIDATSAMAVAAYPANGGLSSTASPLMRAESIGSPADNQPGASSPASMPARATALDWESLFDQFSRRLLRQLAIERERRGGKGWS